MLEMIILKAKTHWNYSGNKYFIEVILLAC